MAYDPTADFANSYNSAVANTNTAFARRRGLMQQDTAGRGVSTSGVGTIPIENHNRDENQAISGLTSQYALDQAHTGIEDRRRAEDYQRQLELNRQGFDLESSLQRRLGQNQLYGQLGAGALGAAGAYLRPH